MELGTYRLAEINKGGGLRQKAVGAATQYLNGVGEWVDMPTAMTPTAHNHDATYLKLTGGTLTGALTGTSATLTGTLTAGTINGSGLTASRAVVTDGSKNLVSSTVTSEQIGFLSEVTSSVQRQLNNIMPVSGTARANIATPTVYEMAAIDCQFNNKIAFYDINYILIESSTDDVTYSDAGISDTKKKRLVSENNNAGISIPKGEYLRITLTSTGYVFLNALYLYTSTNGGTMNIKIEGYLNSSGTWSTFVDYSNPISTWPGHAILRHGKISFNPSNPGQYGKVRITLKTNLSGDSNDTNYPTETLSGIQWLGSYPAGRRTIYWWDEDKKVFFPSDVSATTFTGALSGNAATATKLATPRTISLTGSVTGSGSFDGSGDLSISTTTNHSHAWSSVTDKPSSYTPSSHASSANTYGLATASLYGHAMASSATPLVAGTAAVGTDNGKYAREGHVHPAQTSVSGSAGSCTGNAATATKLATARTISLSGSVTGSGSFDGSGDLSITTTTNHTHSYLPLSGGTMTGAINLSNGGIYKSGWDGNRIAYFVSGDLTTSSEYTTDSFAKADHTHSGYAVSNHTHSIPDLYCGVPNIVPGRILISGSGGSSNPTWLDAGTNGKILGWTSGAPAWVDAPSGSSVSPANPTASVGLAAVNGSATTFMRSDAAPKLDVTIAPTWTGNHTFSGLTKLANVGIGVDPSTSYKLYVVENKKITTAGSYIGNYLIAKYNTALTSGTRQGIAFLGQLWATGGTLTHAKGLDFKVYVPSGTVTEATAINAVIQTDGGTVGTAYALKLSRSGTAPTVANYGIYQDDASATNVFNGPCKFNGGTDLLPSGTNGQFLSLVSGAPAWVDAPSSGGGRVRNFRTMSASGTINHESGTDTLVIATNSTSEAALGLPTTATTGDRIEVYSTTYNAYFTCPSAKILPVQYRPNDSSGLVTSWGSSSGGSGYGIGAPGYFFAIWDGTYWRVGYLSPQY